VSGLAGGADPFSALGLPPRADLTDDDVRAAWRRVATASHPDRADGGDPERFAVAAAAYTVLRTRSGRGEALADLASTSPAPGRSRAPGSRPRRRPDPQGRPDGAARPDRAARPDGAARPDRAARPDGAARTDSRSRRPDTSPHPVTSPHPDTSPHPATAAWRLDTAAQPGGVAGPKAFRLTWPGHLGAARLLSRIRRGRPARLALRVLIAAALSAVAVAVAGSEPATPALITGALTWLLLTGRHDLAPPP
jgi:curved DNA-binding protein CbpA